MHTSRIWWRSRDCSILHEVDEIAAFDEPSQLIFVNFPYLGGLCKAVDRCANTRQVGEPANGIAKFFRQFGEENSKRLRFVCSDMWQPYLKVIAKKASGAIHVLDRFHIMMHMNKAIDEVRAQEVRDLKAKGCEPILTHSRWCLLKRQENLTAKQVVKLKELIKYNLKVVRSYLLKEQFQFFWQYTYPFWAGEFLDQWCSQVMRSKIEQMKKVARMLRSHRKLLLNWFRAKKKISSGVIEGLNNKLKLTMKKSYGFRTFETLEVALYHTLGDLPEPESTHRFW